MVTARRVCVFVCVHYIIIAIVSGLSAGLALSGLLLMITVQSSGLHKHSISAMTTPADIGNPPTVQDVSSKPHPPMALKFQRN